MTRSSYVSPSPNNLVRAEDFDVKAGFFGQGHTTFRILSLSPIKQHMPEQFNLTDQWTKKCGLDLMTITCKTLLYASTSSKTWMSSPVKHFDFNK